jgi:hypothetical protein
MWAETLLTNAVLCSPASSACLMRCYARQKANQDLQNFGGVVMADLHLGRMSEWSNDHGRAWPKNEKEKKNNNMKFKARLEAKL